MSKNDTFKYIELPEEHKAPFLSKDLDLQAMHSECMQELTLQQSKRDQLIAFYLTITGLVSSYLFAADVNFAIRTAIFAALFVIGCVWAKIIIRYKIYKDVYWICCKTITGLYSADRERIDKAYLQHTFYKTIEKTYRDIPRDKKDKNKPSLYKYIKVNLGSAEYLMFLTLVLLLSLSGIGFLLSLSFFLGLGWIGYVVTAVLVLAFVLIQTISYNRAALSIYKVVIDKKDSSFSKTFKKAWFLHFFI